MFENRTSIFAQEASGLCRHTALRHARLRICMFYSAKRGDHAKTNLLFLNRVWSFGDNVIVDGFTSTISSLGIREDVVLITGVSG
jgi:hypothetical protein